MDGQNADRHSVPMSAPLTEPAAERQSHYNQLREFSLSLPETTAEFPWGHSAVKVRKKTVVFLSAEGHRVGMSAKLPDSAIMALMLPFSESTGYGLGKSGWISASFQEGDVVPLPLLKDWIEESYRAMAPKKLSKLLD